MKLTIFFIFITLFATVVAANNIASNESEQWVENQWVVDVIDETNVQATVNGQVTHGDRLRVRFVKENCEVGNLLTSVLTYSDHPEISELGDRYVEAVFMGQQYTLRILFTVPFLQTAHSSWIDLGWVSIDALKISLSEKENISLEFINSDKLIITDYFDILENRWSNTGLSEALDRAAAICKRL